MSWESRYFHSRKGLHLLRIVRQAAEANRVHGDQDS